MHSAKTRKGNKRKLVIILSIIGGVVLLLAAMVIATTPGRDELKNLVVADVDFGNLQDGVYTGAYRGTKDSFRNAAVEVTVESGAVKKIKVTEGALAGDKQETKIGKGQTIKNLFDEIIENQSLQVDVVSGATLTSKAHLNAVENALKQAEGK